MAIQKVSNFLIYGLSTDTKPTNYATNTLFVEQDTNTFYRYTGSTWSALTSSSSSGPYVYTYLIYKSGSTYYAKPGDGVSSTTSNSDFKTLIQGLINGISPAGTPTLIQLGTGDFDVNTQILVPTSAIGNITIKGMGMGLTNLNITSTWNGTTLDSVNAVAIKFGAMPSITTGITGTLTANCPIRSMTLTVSTPDAAKFAVGDLILLTSTLAWSTAPSASSPQAEIKKITAISTGTITFDVPTFDTYNTANTAVIYKLSNMIKNMTLSNLTIRKGSGLNTDTGNTTGVVFFQANCVENMQLDRVQLIDTVSNYDTGLTLISCINSNINNCYIYQNPTQTYNLQYGITLDSCCQNITVSDCRSFGRWRHPFEMCNDQTGSGLQGIGRNISVQNCVSEGSEVASFDVHPGGEMISFDNCKVLGTTDSTGSVGFEIRTRKTQLVGCSVEGANTYGIQFSGDAHDGIVSSCVSRGCVAEGLRTVNDQAGIKRIKIVGCHFSDNGNNGIRFDSGCDYATIIGNTINANLNHGMYLLGSDHLLISNNIVTNNTNSGIWLDAGSNNIINTLVTENDVTGNGTNLNITGLFGGNTQINNNINGVAITSGVVCDPFTRRTGYYQPAQGTTLASVGNANGIIGSHVVTGTGTISNTFDTTEGILINLASTSTAGQNIGLVSPTGGVGVGRRLFGMRAKIRSKVDVVAASASRFYFGFTSASTLPITDTPLANTDHGIIVGFSSADTTYQIYRNDGATSVTKTAVTGNISKDTNFHTIEIIWIAAGNISVVFDGVPQIISTDLPATTANLFFNAVVQTVATAAKTFTIKGIWIEAEK